MRNEKFKNGFCWANKKSVKGSVVKSCFHFRLSEQETVHDEIIGERGETRHTNHTECAFQKAWSRSFEKLSLSGKWWEIYQFWPMQRKGEDFSWYLRARLPSDPCCHVSCFAHVKTMVEDCCFPEGTEWQLSPFRFLFTKVLPVVFPQAQHLFFTHNVRVSPSLQCLLAALSFPTKPDKTELWQNWKWFICKKTSSMWKGLFLEWDCTACLKCASVIFIAISTQSKLSGAWEDPILSKLETFWRLLYGGKQTALDLPHGV